MTLPKPGTAALISLAALALGFVAFAGQGADEAPTVQTTQQGLDCAVEVTPRNGQLQIEGVVSAGEATVGTYHLRVTRGGTLLTQDGAFFVAPGDTTTLGQVTLNGPATGLEADLSLDISGLHLFCPDSL